MANPGVQSAQSFLQKRVIAGALEYRSGGNAPCNSEMFTKIPLVREPSSALIASALAVCV